MAKKKNRSLLALLAAFIWGISFVSQSLSAGHIGSFTFNAVRAIVGTLSLLAVLLIRGGIQRKKGVTSGPRDLKLLVKGGLACGSCMAVGAFLQQWGIESTTAGKAGFITALYVVLVPLAAIFLKKRVSPRIWLSVLLAAAGLYFLCLKKGEGFRVNQGDLLVFCCAFFYTGQILCIDHFAAKTDGVELSLAQFAVMAVICSLCAPIFETVTLESIRVCLPHILYVGIFSSAVAYTLQIMAQKDGNPAVVSLLLCLESFFAALSGAVLLGDTMTAREYFGCGLMLTAVILSQLPEKRTLRRKKD